MATLYMLPHLEGKVWRYDDNDIRHALLVAAARCFWRSINLGQEKPKADWCRYPTVDDQERRRGEAGEPMKAMMRRRCSECSDCRLRRRQLMLPRREASRPHRSLIRTSIRCYSRPAEVASQRAEFLHHDWNQEESGETGGRNGDAKSSHERVHLRNKLCRSALSRLLAHLPRPHLSASASSRAASGASQKGKADRITSRDRPLYELISHF